MTQRSNKVISSKLLQMSMTSMVKRITGITLLPVFALGLYMLPQNALANSGDEVEVINSNSAEIFNFVSAEAETGDNQANGGDGGNAGSGGDGEEGGEGGEGGDGDD